MNKNTYGTFIELPLVIGSQQLNQRQKQTIELNAQDYKLSMNIKNNKSFQNFIQNSKNNISSYACNYKIISQKQLLVYTMNNNRDLLSFNSQQQSLVDDKFYVYNTPANEYQQDEINSQNGHKFSYRVQFSKQGKQSHRKGFNCQDNIRIRIIQQNISFQLIKITSQIKFVQNQLSLSLLSSSSKPQQSEPSYGLLTMDKQNRIILQNINTKHPVIGFWLSTQKSIENIECYELFLKYFKQKYEKKCLFKYKLSNSYKKYFYFVKINKSKKSFDKYLVSWKQNQSTVKEIITPFSQRQFKFSSDYESKQQVKIKISNQSQQIYNSKGSKSRQSNYNGFKNSDVFAINSLQTFRKTQQDQGQNIDLLQFTLRKQIKPQKHQFSTLQSLINYSYLSPIKQLENNHNQVIESSSNGTEQNSPQFVTSTKKINWQLQRQFLLNELKQKENQISQLKQKLLQKQSQLIMYKNSRMSTNCDSNRKVNKFNANGFSSRKDSFDIKSNTDSKNPTSPRDIKRLRQSDLRSQSITLSDCIINSSNKKRMFNFKMNQEVNSNQNSQQIKKPRNQIISQIPTKLIFNINDSDSTKKYSNISNSISTTNFNNEMLYQNLPQITQQQIRQKDELQLSNLQIIE